MKILITGSTGLLGSEAVSYFREKGAEVIGIDNNMRSYFFGVKQDEPELRIDIRDGYQIENLFLDHKFDAVIHTAAQPSHDYSKDHVIEDFDINARGTLILLEATRTHCPEATFIYVSTDKVYGQGMVRDNLQELETRYHHDKPFNEETEFKTKYSPFGISKRTGDLYAQEYSEQGWIKNVGIFRPGCITGKNHKGAELHGFLAYLAKCIKEEKTYKVFGYEGKQVRDQIHAHDLASAFWFFIQEPKTLGIYNIGGGEERSVSILEAIDLIEKQTGMIADVEYIEQERKGDRIWDIHDVSKFKKDYPEWNYKYSLQDIIKDLCQ